MAAKPLSLKREKSRHQVKEGAFSSSAQVLLNHEIVHLDQSFSYGIPEKLRDSVTVGSLVQVPFNRNEIEGVVVAVNEAIESSLKPIIKVLKKSAFNLAALSFANDVAKRYACSAVKILTLMTPISKDDEVRSSSNSTSVKVNRRFIPENFRTFAALIRQLKSGSGTRLIFVPSKKEALFLLEKLNAELGNQVITFEAWKKLKGEDRNSRIIVGMRGMIFIQVSEITEIFIFDEASEHYWEQRSPFWNLRDVALLRSRAQAIPLSFISGAPSLELLRLGQTDYLRLDKPSRTLFRRRNFTVAPESFHQTVRNGLRKGPVLVSVAKKSYSHALICKKCSTVPKCDCGFPLKMIKRDQILCTLCGIAIHALRCRECAGLEFLQIGKGVERIKEEFAKAFPNIAILISTADHELDPPRESAIVLSTPGVEPRAENYGGLVLLDGMARISRPTLRAEEQLRNHWHRLIALIAEDAPIFISLPSSNPITQSLISGDPYRGLNSTLRERSEAKLPPGYRVIKIKGEFLSALASKLKLEFEGLEISRISKSDEVIIRVETSKAQELINSLYSLQKYRGASGKSLLSLEIDPYDI